MCTPKTSEAIWDLVKDDEKKKAGAQLLQAIGELQSLWTSATDKDAQTYKDLVHRIRELVRNVS